MRMRFLLYPLLPVIFVAELAVLAIEIPLGTSGAATDAIDKLGAKITNKIADKKVIDLDTTYPKVETKGEGE